MIGALAALVVLGADGGVLVGSGALSMEEIAEAIGKNRQAFRHCYEREHELQGKVSVTFLIGSDGRVRSATASPTPLPTRIVACLMAGVKAIVFPPPKAGATVTVTYPFVFSKS